MVDKLTALNSITNHEVSLLDYIKELVKESKSLDLMVSFIMLSGVEALLQEWHDLREKRVPVRILTGTYLGITEPYALYRLKELLGDQLDLRFFSDTGISFHPKAYFFYREDNDYLIIGSSNLSKSALIQGMEWNYRLTLDQDPEAFSHYLERFNRVFHEEAYPVTREVLRDYSRQWHRPRVSLDHSKPEPPVTRLFKPNPSQIEALYELKALRDDGADKGLVVAATGLGKTFLAAFDGKDFSRILFIAHREEILFQAKATYESLGYEDTGYYTGTLKEAQKKVLFASVMTLGNPEHLERFKPDAFDYLVIDEFHHSAAKTYQSIIRHFKPRFMLGLTATPHRMDNEDIFAIMDYNVAYEADLFTAINKGWLVPFHYYGIHDATVDYDNITYIGGRYKTEDLEKHLSIHTRAELVLSHFNRRAGDRTLGFCTSIAHADYMADHFNRMGVSSLSVHSGSGNRGQALEDFRDGHLKVIFAVDLFNEGLDVKTIDTVMFLRPTESPTVFLQQLGRGLRTYPGKKHLTVLDFIGNFKKVTLIPYLLSGRNGDLSRQGRIDLEAIQQEAFYPDGCRIDFDFEVIDLFESYLKEQTTLAQRVREEFERIEALLGEEPDRVALLIHMDQGIYTQIKSKKKYNPFKDYLSYRNPNSGLVGTIAHDFIKMIENTSMNKLYKLPVLLAFYNRGDIKPVIDEEDLYQSFRIFYSNGQNALDMHRHQSTTNFKSWGKKEFVRLAMGNPVHFLNKTHGEFFDIEDRKFRLNDRLEPFLSLEEFKREIIDAIEFRRIEFLRDRLESR